MHGGLFSEDGVTLDDLRKIERNRQPPDSGRLIFQMQHESKSGSQSFFAPVVSLIWFGRTGKCVVVAFYFKHQQISRIINSLAFEIVPKSHISDRKNPWLGWFVCFHTMNELNQSPLGTKPRLFSTSIFVSNRIQMTAFTPVQMDKTKWTNPPVSILTVWCECTIKKHQSKGKCVNFNTVLFSFTGPMCDLLWSDPQPQVSSHTERH